jgi:hypothetical protein
MAYSETEMRELKTVFGENVTFDKDGRPIEQGIGSGLQPKVFPTLKPPGGVKPVELEFLRKMVAATASKALQLDFERYLAWREAHPEQTTVEILTELLTSLPDPALDPEKVRVFRGRLRAGDIPPPISVRKIADGQYAVIEGRHRIAAARDEGRKTVRAEIVREVPDPRSVHNEQSESF